MIEDDLYEVCCVELKSEAETEWPKKEIRFNNLIASMYGHDHIVVGSEIIATLGITPIVGRDFSDEAWLLGILSLVHD